MPNLLDAEAGLRSSQGLLRDGKARSNRYCPPCL